MPIYPNAKALIKLQLERVAANERVKPIPIGSLTPEQFEALNAGKAEFQCDLLGDPEVLYVGAHHFKSRMLGDGYTFDDLYLQIEAVLHASSVVIVKQRTTLLRSQHDRADGYGNFVRDEGVLELNSRKPKSELFSAIPKGDQGGPKKKKAP